MTKGKRLITASLLALIVTLLPVGGAGANTPGIKVRSEPQEQAVDLNEVFVVQVTIEEANNLGAFQFKLVYDPSIVQVTDFALGDFLESTGNSVVPIQPEVNTTEGEVTIGAFSFGEAQGPSGTGILAAIFTLARIIAWLLDNQPVFVWSFFFGLILASVLTVTRQIDRWTAPIAFSGILGAAGAYWLVGLVPMNTPNEPWFLFISGAIAICAMILPGISGSFILVLLGKYYYVLRAVNNRDFLTLSIFAAGAAVGIILFSRLLGWLLRRYHDLTIAVLCGLMVGSLRKVWPWKIEGLNRLPVRFDAEVWLAILLMIIGLVAVLSMDWWVRKKKK